MDEKSFLAQQFEANRARLRGVAYRMLGSLSEAEDAVQEAWLRLGRADAAGVDNLGGWLTTVVARICLDMLRSRKARREDALDAAGPEPVANDNIEAVLEQESQLADSVGLALLVVLQTLAPAERIAFVLHDMFDLPFDEIAPVVGRSPTAARQLASRARRRVQGKAAEPDTDRDAQRRVVDAFLTAARGGDMQGLLAALDPDIVVRSDAAARKLGASPEVHGAERVARFYLGKAQEARPALVDGSVGIVVAPRGRLFLALKLTFANNRIAGIDVVADPAQLRNIDVAAFAV
jgi:RNA polymerase sigma-70 factor (ECF subfamily)